MISSSDGLPPLTWLRAFEASARHLSFTRAAQELGLTQSAVSQHVRSLETHLGRALFLRKTRVLELTEDGSNYLPGIREAFGLIAHSTDAFRGARGKNTFRLQCNLAFSVFWLAPRLHRLYARHPWIVVEIVSPIWDPERHATQAAIEIRFGRPEEMSATAEPVAQEHFFPVCAPQYQDGAVDLTVATLFDCAGTTGTWQAWMKSAGLAPSTIKPVNLCSTYVTALHATLNGAGLTMAHDTLVADLLREGKLVRPFDHAPALSEGYYLFPPSPALRNRAADAFLEWFREERERLRAERGGTLAVTP